MTILTPKELEEKLQENDEKYLVPIILLQNYPINVRTKKTE